MKEIDINDPMPDRITAIVYGPSGAGKTEFAATWPKPLIIAQKIEDGYETVRHMDRGKWYEPSVKPRVLLAETMADLPQMVKIAEEGIAKGEIQTVVFDQVTAWLDLVQDYLGETHREEAVKNKYFIPGKTFSHARHMAISFHRMKVNVVWTALENFNEDTKTGQPLLPGQTAKKLPSWCKVIFFANVDRMDPTKPPEYQIRTRPFNRYIARTRFGPKLPDPLPPDPINPAWGPTYRSIEACLKAAQVQQAAPKAPTAAQKVAPK